MKRPDATAPTARQKEFRKQLVGWVLAIDAVIVAALLAWWFSR